MAEEENTEEVGADGPEKAKEPTPRFDPEALGQDSEDKNNDDAIYVDDMYGDWFLDYASYAVSYTHLTLPTTPYV